MRPPEKRAEPGLGWFMTLLSSIFPTQILFQFSVPPAPTTALRNTCCFLVAEQLLKGMEWGY